MIAVLFRFRSEARRAWTAWVALGLLFGVVGGATIAALAGARRTETAYQRFLDATRAFDVLLVNGGTTSTNINRQFDFDDVARLPGVSDAALLGYYLPLGGTAPRGQIGNEDFSPFVAVDGRYGRELNRHRVLAGRLPLAEREVAVSRLAAQRTGLHVGDTFAAELGGASSLLGTGAPPPPSERFRVVGLVATQAGFPPGTGGGLPPPLLLSARYAKSHPDFAQVFGLRLVRGSAGVADVERALVDLAGGEQVVITNAAEQTKVVQRGLDVQAAVLRLVGLAAAIVGTMLVGQAMARRAAIDAGESRALRALGFGWGHLFGLGSARTLVIALVSATVTPIVAIALSVLTPVGPARDAEIHPGIEVNVALVGLGTIAVTLVVVVLGLLVTSRALRLDAGHGADDAASGRRRILPTGALPPAATVGVTMALTPGRARAAVPVRSTLAGAALGVAALVAVATFASSIRHLLDDPRLYGWNWDVQIGDSFAPDLRPRAQELSRRDDVESGALASSVRVRVGSVPLDVLAIEQHASIQPTIVVGRAAEDADEIVLGTRTLEDIGRQVGERVTVSLGRESVPMRIVGRGVFNDSSSSTRLGDGAATTLEGLRRLAPDLESDVLLVRLRPDVSTAAFLASYRTPAEVNLYLPTKPADLSELERVGGLPSVVAGGLALLAVGALAHALATSARRRRRDFAVLKTLGFTRRQVSGAVAWQASVLAGAAALIGVPLGLGAGRWAWITFAGRLGVPARPVLPLLVAVLAVPATLLIGNVVAAVPAWIAARTQPAAVLRTD